MNKKNNTDYIISRQQVTTPPISHTLHTSVNYLSQCSQSPVKLQLSPKDIDVVHTINALKSST